MKNYLKSNRNHIAKQTIKLIELNFFLKKNRDKFSISVFILSVNVISIQHKTSNLTKNKKKKDDMSKNNNNNKYYFLKNNQQVFNTEHVWKRVSTCVSKKF
jgi:hypothetical protein